MRIRRVIKIYSDNGSRLSTYSEDVGIQVDTLVIEIDWQHFGAAGAGRGKRKHAIVRNAGRVRALAVVLNRGIITYESQLIDARFNVHSSATVLGQQQHVIQHPQSAQKRIAHTGASTAGERIGFAHAPWNPALLRRSAQSHQHVFQSRLGMEQLAGSAAST